MKEFSKTINYQLSIFDAENSILKELEKELRNLNIDALTPIEAMMKLNEIKNKLLPVILQK